MKYRLLVLAICAGIFLVVGGLLAYTVVRFRRRPGDEGHEPPQIYGSNQLEFAWTVIPIVIVFVLFLATARTIYDVQGAVPPADALNVTVVGHQWWWEIRYPELGIVTANELHVPVSEPDKARPTFLKLESADVVHSFWVPQLAGKTDVIPNRENRMWIEPTQPGTYVGNCAEYCGMQHAHMLLRVIVHPPGEFESGRRPSDNRRWTIRRRGPAATFSLPLPVSTVTPSGKRRRGARLVPTCTHLMSRETLGAGTVPNTAEKLRAWVRDPQTIKEGCNMPNMQLTDTELNQIVAYLLTLK